MCKIQKRKEKKNTKRDLKKKWTQLQFLGEWEKEMEKEQEDQFILIWITAQQSNAI